jgi:hypothetical protein
MLCKTEINFLKNEKKIYIYLLKKGKENYFHIHEIKNLRFN